MKYLEFCGPIIRYYREQKSLDIGSICILTGIQKPQYVELEKGKKEVLLGTWKRICDVVGIDFVYLFKNEDIYEDLYQNCLHALIYDDIDEQERLLCLVDENEIKKSILFPKFILLRFMYDAINTDRIPEHLIACLEIFKEVYSLPEQCLFYDYLGYCYQKIKLYDKAREYYRKADALATLEHKELLYYHMGMLYYKLNQPLPALYNLRKAYGMFEKGWNINRLLYTHGSIGICYIRMSEFDMAKIQLEETIRLAQQYKNSYVIVTTYDNLTFNSFKMRDYEGCIHYGLKAIDQNTCYSYLYFFLAYSYAKLGKEEEAWMWIDKSEDAFMDKAALELMQYARMLLLHEENTDFLKALYDYLAEEEFYELQKFILIELAEALHALAQFESEAKCLRELLKLSK